MNQFLDYYSHKGHVFGECMSCENTDLMYVYIPKNASSWTKPNLKDWQWEMYNYHKDNLYHKHAIVILRDPVDRWLSGIAEYMFLYHNNMDWAHFSKPFFDIVFDRVALDDHTERQSLFIDGLDLDRCTFFNCDQNYRQSFSTFLNSHGMSNKYHGYEYQHTTEASAKRKKFKQLFTQVLNENSKYLNKLTEYFREDYQLIKSIKFYAG